MVLPNTNPTINISFLYPLKMSETLWFADFFKGYRNGTLT